MKHLLTLTLGISSSGSPEFLMARFAILPTLRMIIRGCERDRERERHRERGRESHIENIQYRDRWRLRYMRKNYPHYAKVVESEGSFSFRLIGFTMSCLPPFLYARRSSSHRLHPILECNSKLQPHPKHHRSVFKY